MDSSRETPITAESSGYASPNPNPQQANSSESLSLINSNPQTMSGNPLSPNQPQSTATNSLSPALEGSGNTAEESQVTASEDPLASNNRLMDQIATIAQGDDTLEAQLRALVSTLKARGIVVPHWPYTVADYCLDGLPAEVRGHIFKFLLCNPILATADAVQGFPVLYTDQLDGDAHHSPVKYDLDTAILRVCKKFYREGMEYLYHTNTFFNACVARDPDFCIYNFNPLTRYLKLGASSSFTSIVGLTGMDKVMRWNVVLTHQNVYTIPQDMPPNRTLLDFCRAICHSSPISIDFKVVPMGVNGPSNYLNLPNYLEPLSLLRSVGSMKVEDALLTEIPWCFILGNGAPGPYTPTNPDNLPRVRALKAIAAGNSPKDHLYEMYCSLLTYAQSYERYSPFAEQMGLFTEERLNLDFFGSPDSRPLGCTEYLFNPFKGSHIHPVERSLVESKIACDRNDIASFQIHRDAALQYLENQYQRIAQASLNLIAFIKFEKREGGLLDAKDKFINPSSRDNMLQRCGTALVLVEDYSAAFTRECPLELRGELKRLKLRISSPNPFSQASGDTAIPLLEEALCSGSLEKFLKQFPCVVDELERKMVKIMRLRKALFKHEMAGNTGCEIQPLHSETEDSIFWGENEPFVEVKERPWDWVEEVGEEEEEEEGDDE